jgi:tRNA(fMet)-specific endonuclease VapC
MHYMLDTNICIYIAKRNPPQVVRRLRVLSKGSAVMSVLTYAELWAGLELQSINREQDTRALAELTDRIPVLPFTDAEAVCFGALRAAVRERNRDTIDRLIAAHAVSLNLTLVTNNEADFKGYPGLRVENWAVPDTVV